METERLSRLFPSHTFLIYLSNIAATPKTKDKDKTTNCQFVFQKCAAKIITFFVLSHIITVTIALLDTFILGVAYILGLVSIRERERERYIYIYI